MSIAPVVDDIPAQCREDQQTVDDGKYEKTERYRDIAGAKQHRADKKPQRCYRCSRYGRSSVEIKHARLVECAFAADLPAGRQAPRLPRRDW
ncbi:hypothetical protein C4585_02150 [Candidatus Parcubacteria bacterium]|nr:MAG: hypothetical protein C4585_02150 [Candidatus Parcubacteria bacterium]